MLFSQSLIWLKLKAKKSSTISSADTGEWEVCFLRPIYQVYQSTWCAIQALSSKQNEHVHLLMQNWGFSVLSCSWSPWSSVTRRFLARPVARLFPFLSNSIPSTLELREHCDCSICRSFPFLLSLPMRFFWAAPHNQHYSVFCKQNPQPQCSTFCIISMNLFWPQDFPPFQQRKHFKEYNLLLRDLKACCDQVVELPPSDPKQIPYLNTPLSLDGIQEKT